MEEYFSYDEALEERIREDHEVQDFIDKLASRAIADWSRFYRCPVCQCPLRAGHEVFAHLRGMAGRAFHRI